MNDQSYRDLGQRVCQHRHGLHLTQEALAARVGVTASFLGHIERGTRILSVDTLVKLCRALDLTPNELLGMPYPPSARRDDMTCLAQELLQTALDLLNQRP